MGFQTNISILNDHLDWIEKHPETFTKAVVYGMHDGTDSFVSDAMNARMAERQGDEYYDPHFGETKEERQARAHYVTVHRAQHADVPQVTFTHRNSSIDIYDLARGFELDSPRLDQNRKFWPKQAREIAKELRRQATYLQNAAQDWEERHADDSERS